MPMPQMCPCVGSQACVGWIALCRDDWLSAYQSFAELYPHDLVAKNATRQHDVALMTSRPFSCMGLAFAAANPRLMF